MPKIGEAWYEIGAKDEKLVRAISGAEAKAKSSGPVIEGAVGDGATKGFDKAGASATRFGGTLGKLSGTTSRFSGVMGALGTGVLQGVGIAGFMGVSAAAGALVEGIGRSISAASDLQETISKVGVVFGANAKQIEAWASDSATAMGLSKNAALAAAATYGNLFVALQLPADASADMSKSLVKLAGDLASFNNVPVDDALQALQSGLVGETEPLRRFGVNLNEATIAQKALELGLISSVKQAVTPAIKAQASYALIMEQTTTAQGDFARTSTGLANQQRIASAKVEDAFARMGAAIVPIAQTIVPALADAFTVVLDAIGNLIRGIGDWFDQNKMITDALKGLASVLITVLGFALGRLGDALGVLVTVTTAGWNAIVGVVKTAVGGIIGAIRNVMDIAAQVPGPWQEGAKAVSASLSAMQKDVEAWGTATVKTAGETGKGVPSAVAGPIKAGEPTVAAAAKAGITDPVVAQTQAAATDAGKAAKATPDAIAKSLIDGQFNVKDAAESLKDVQKNALSKTKEIAKIEGFLSGDALAKALRDKRPAVRAEAEAWKAAAEDRLFALKNGVPAIALRTGQVYADALAAKKQAVKDAAEKQGSAVTGVYRNVKENADNWGKKTGTAYANGLGGMSWYLAAQTDLFLKRAKAKLESNSPPREGPFKPIDRWGENLAKTYADAFVSASDYFTGKVELFLSAPAMTTATAPTSLASGATVPVAAAPAAGAPITLAPVYAPLLNTATPGQTREAARALTGALMSELQLRGVLPRIPGMT